MDLVESLRQVLPPEEWERFAMLNGLQSKPEPSPVSCPICGASDWIPVVHGFPSSELFERADRGEVILGGCMIDPGRGESDRCGNCGASWNGFEAVPAE